MGTVSDFRCESGMVTVSDLSCECRVSFIVKAIFQLYRDSVVGSCAALAAIRKSHRNVVRSFRRRFLQRGGHAAVLLQVLASAVVELHLQFSQSFFSENSQNVNGIIYELLIVCECFDNFAAG